MAQRIRAFDWGSNPLGPPARWPAALRTMVRMALLTRHPVFVFWGPAHLCLYNDAYSASLGPEKHPGILGRPGREAFAEIWDIIGPQIRQVLRGEGATWHENQLVPIIRHGGLQDVYWTYSFAPIDDQTAPDGIGGVLVLCTETTAQVLAQERLSTEHQRLSSLFAQAPNFIALLNGPDHVFELVNPAYTGLIGGRDVLGKPVAEALPETVDQGYVGILDEVYRSGRPYIASSAAYRSPGTGGDERFLDFVYQPITDAGGGVNGIFVVGSDVTERNRALKALERSEEQLRLATDAAEVGLWDVDLVEDTLYWPARVKAMFGISPQVPVSMADFYAGLHPADKAATSEAFAAAADPQRRALYDVEYRTVGREDGVVRWVAAKGRGIFREGRCVRVIGSVVDITRRKRDEQRIKELHDTLEKRVDEYLAERKLFADLVDGTDALIQVSDLDFNWLAINGAAATEFERIFGVRPAVGANMLKLLDDLPPHRAAVQAVWQRALDGEEFIDVQEFGDPSRARRYYEMRFRSLHDARGGRIGAYQFVYDVTERLRGEERLARAEAALRQSQKMEAVGQLTGGLAHDFNNLLQAARSHFELLRRSAGDPATVVKIAERGVDVTKKAARLTTQLLTFSRRQSLDIRPVGLKELLHGMEDLLRATLGAPIKLTVGPIDEALWVLADPTQLEMALLNLSINARDAMPAGGQLEVFVREDPGPGDDAPDTPDAPISRLVELCVGDTGLGMSEDVAARAFDPFFTTKGIGQGSGLGLSQVYGMATRANGSARIESVPGRGTTVILGLPRTRPALADDRSDDRPLPASGGLKGSILVIDDDADVRRGLVAALLSLGHKVLDAAEGDAGLTILEKEPVDAVLLDFAMPGMTGAEVAHLARLQRPDLPIVFMSGYSDTEAIAAAVGQGAVLLRKPFDIQSLHHALQRTMSRPAGGAE